MFNFIFNLLKFISSNDFITILMELIIVIIWLYSIYYPRTKKNSGFLMKRGSPNWEFFPIAFGSLSLIVVEIIGNSTIFREYKNILIIANLLILFKLCFNSDWFRNKIVGFYIKYKEKIEKLG